MKTSIVEMTPHMASEILKQNTSNRKVRWQAVKEFDAVIKRGAWQLTHQGVAISTEGILLDGQHRLLAIASSGATLPIMLSVDVAPETYDAIDVGIRRSLVDMFKIDSRVTEMLRFAAQLHQNTRASVVSPDTFKAYSETPLKTMFADLIEHTGTARKGHTSVGTRVSACLMKYEQNSDYQFDQYRACAILDFESMSKYVRSYFKYVTDNVSSFSSGGYQQYIRLAAGMKAFDEERKGLAQFKLLKSEQNALVEQARSIIDEIINS